MKFPIISLDMFLEWNYQVNADLLLKVPLTIPVSISKIPPTAACYSTHVSYCSLTLVITILLNEPQSRVKQIWGQS